MLALAAISFAASIITGHSISWNRNDLPVAILYVVWEFVYFAYSWGASGKTLGMALLGVRVVAADGTEAGPRRAVIRTLAFPLSFLLLGLGFTGILFQRDRRALHDMIAGTAVVYYWPPARPGSGTWTGQPGRPAQARTLSWLIRRRGGVSPTLGDAC